MVPEFSHFSIKEYAQVLMVVQSHLLQMEIYGLNFNGFVPYADCLYRDTYGKMWYYSYEHKGFIIKSNKSISNDTYNFDKYGRKTNERFFVNYGFVNLTLD